MQKKIWLVVMMCLIIPCFMFTVSCQKKVSAQATVTPKPVIAAPSAPSAPSMSSPTVANVMDERIHFAFDKALLTAEAQTILKKKVEWMKANPNAKLVIEGNCDERGTAEYNIALGERRAVAAKAFLIDAGGMGPGGVSPDRIKTISFGKEKPLCKESNEACWAKNRNDGFVVK
jgi:peptidoglycan-associated lipoprotein